MMEFSANSTILPWQTALWERLMALVHAERLPHALLLTGPHGVGKTTLARCLAQSLLCERPLASGMGCATCPACRRMLAGSHPDFFWVRPDAELTAESSDDGDHESGSSERVRSKKGSRYIRIDQIRALSEWMGLKSHYEGHKVALLAPAEQMNLQAANSLLKTLEAPPGAALIMLTTTHPAQLTATIRSRCQTLACPPVTLATAHPWLVAQGVPDQEVATLLTLADGGPLTAVNLAQSGVLAQRLTLFAELEGVITGCVAPVTVAQAWLNREAERTIAWQWSWTADMLRLALVPHAHLANPDLAQRLAALAQRLGVRRLYARLDHLSAALRLVRGPTNPNLQLLWEDILIPWRA